MLMTLTSTLLTFPSRYVRPLCFLQVFPTTGLRHRMLVGGSLEFTSVRLEDAGKYVCTASNEAGSVRREISLDVQGNANPSVQSI